MSADVYIPNVKCKTCRRVPFRRVLSSVWSFFLFDSQTTSASTDSPNILLSCLPATIAQPRGFYRGVSAPLVGVTPIFATCFWGYDMGLKLCRYEACVSRCFCFKNRRRQSDVSPCRCPKSSGVVPPRACYNAKNWCSSRLSSVRRVLCLCLCFVFLFSSTRRNMYMLRVRNADPSTIWYVRAASLLRATRSSPHALSRRRVALFVACYPHDRFHGPCDGSCDASMMHRVFSPCDAGLRPGKTPTQR